MSAGLSIALCAVLAVTAQTSDIAVGATVVLAAGLIAGAASEAAASRSAGSVVLVGSVVSVVLTLRPELLDGMDSPVVGPALLLDRSVLVGAAPGAALVVIGALLVQLRPHDGRPQGLAALASTTTLGLLATMLAAWVAQDQAAGGAPIVQVSAAAIAAATLALVLPGPGAVGTGMAVVVGALAGGVAAYLAPGAPIWPFGAALGLTMGVLTATGRAVGARWSLDPRQSVPMEAVLPFVLTGPTTFILAGLFAF